MYGLKPYSRHTPEYSHDRLKTALENSCIRYVFMGKELGARREEPECYVDGKVLYELVSKTPAFREGISRLEEGAKTHRIALLRLHGCDQVDLFENKLQEKTQEETISRA